MQKKKEAHTGVFSSSVFTKDLQEVSFRYLEGQNSPQKTDLFKASCGEVNLQEAGYSERPLGH